MANPEIKNLVAKAIDPIHIGTGGYTIGRVDNTIVRDPVTKIPKIPGSSVAGTWRYYVALELQSYFKDEYKKDLQKRADKDLKELFNHNENWITAYDGNRYAKIRCAGQDETPQVRLDEASFAQNKDNKTGHCGHCIVCKAFGFSKKDISSQGMLFFSDLNILFFPVYTRFGVRWITSQRLLKENGLLTEEVEQKDVVFISSNEKDTSNKYINLGWLNLPYETQAFKIDLSKIDALDENDIVIVPDALLPQIINSNLEVRTSVSIDPLTGAAKDGALFTSEAIPRGTIFYGEVRCFSRGENLPEIDHVFKALRDSKKYYASLGIGGMTTRGFGRLEVKI